MVSKAAKSHGHSIDPIHFVKCQNLRCNRKRNNQENHRLIQNLSTKRIISIPQDKLHEKVIRLNGTIDFAMYRERVIKSASLLYLCKSFRIHCHNEPCWMLSVCRTFVGRRRLRALQDQPTPGSRVVLEADQKSWSNVDHHHRTGWTLPPGSPKTFSIIILRFG